MPERDDRRINLLSHLSHTEVEIAVINECIELLSRKRLEALSKMQRFRDALEDVSDDQPS